MAGTFSLAGETWYWGSEQVATGLPPMVFYSLCESVMRVSHAVKILKSPSPTLQMFPSSS